MCPLPVPLIHLSLLLFSDPQVREHQQAAEGVEADLQGCNADQLAAELEQRAAELQQLERSMQEQQVRACKGRCASEGKTALTGRRRSAEEAGHSACVLAGWPRLFFRGERGNTLWLPGLLQPSFHHTRHPSSPDPFPQAAAQQEQERQDALRAEACTLQQRLDAWQLAAEAAAQQLQAAQQRHGEAGSLRRQLSSLAEQLGPSLQPVQLSASPTASARGGGPTAGPASEAG